MAIEILEVNASSAVPIVEHCVIERPRTTPEYEAVGFHSMQYRVEFCIADVERVMVALECLCAVAKEQCKTSVDAHRCEVAVVTLEAKPKELREKAGRSLLSRAGTMVWLSTIVIATS